MFVKFAFLIFFGITFPFISCQNKKSKKISNPNLVAINNDSLITIQIPGTDSEIKSQLNFVDIIENISYVPLETNDKCLIGEVHNVLFDDEKIFVIDRYSAEGVFIFDRQGKFLSAINDKGEGPEQFQSVYDVALDKRNKRVLVLDLENPSLIAYDYSGNFLDRRVVEIFFNGFKVADNGTLLMNMPMGRVRNPDSIINYLFTSGSLDTLGVIYSKGLYLGENKDGASVADPYPFIESADGICYTPGFYDTLYAVKEDGLRGIFAFDFDDGGFNIKDNYALDNTGFIEKIKSSNIVEYAKLNLQNYLMFNVSFKNNTKKLIYDKRKNTLHEIVLIMPNMEHSFMLTRLNFYESANRFVSVATALEVKNSRKIDLNKSNFNFPDIDDFDNPILFFYTLN